MYSLNRIFTTGVCLLFAHLLNAQSKVSSVTGVVLNAQDIPVLGATVMIDETHQGVITNEKGEFLITDNFSGTYTLITSYMGYEADSKTLELHAGEVKKVNIHLKESSYVLDEVALTGKSKVQQVKEKAFNVSVVDAKKLHHTTLDIGHVLDRVSGVRVRETGGVGSTMNFSLNGFTGKQVRFFIDGVPMDNYGSSFQLNNIPVNLAERIEVYKGVVPVGLGSDALGGAVNIITNTYKKNHIEASYSYGSFNTHRSYVNAVYVSKKGFTAQLNAYQNFSDNDYKIYQEASEINTGKYYKRAKIKRFHNQYHNEAIVLNTGFINKSFADQLLFGITLGQNYKEIQTGARQTTVFGAWHRRGNTVMPTLKYHKKDLFVKGLDINISANYNLGEEKNIDTLHRRYDWFGDYKDYEELYGEKGGESSYSLYTYKNNNALATTSINYQLNKVHGLVLSSTLNYFNRRGYNKLNSDSNRYNAPMKSWKNVIGLGYNIKTSNWNTSIFVKQYHQENTFNQPYYPNGEYGGTEYRKKTNIFEFYGYGTALTYFLNENLQFKASFEKSYRMPEPNELFGDVENLEGNIGLKPEHSYNYNFGTSYWGNLNKKHQFVSSLNLFYRDARGFIRPRLNNNQAKITMENLVNVSNKGIEADLSYTYNHNLTVGANVSYQDLRNNTKYDEGQTIVSVAYKQRLPNQPFLYGNANAGYTFKKLWNKNDQLNIGYNMLYVYDFYLYWPGFGDPELGKYDVPSQLSHDLNFIYTYNPKLQFTLECRNITDNILYDNFSLQKPGRAFYGKIRYTFL
ncbi:TonB-dependent receptor domain-containing protein [Wenyingzhuangia sp. IMCC45467]